jgi:hypothetical protein
MSSEHGFPYRLVLLRHGQSEWNAAGVFTGWANELRFQPVGGSGVSFAHCRGPVG